MGSRGSRVLIIVQNLPVPFDRRVWLEATSLAHNGYQVSVICPKMRGFNRGFERLESVDIYRYRMPFDASSKLGFIGEFAWAWLATAFLSLRVAMFGRGFDVIHACNPPDTYWLLARIWKIFGKRFIFDHHDLSPEMYQAKFGEGNGFLHRVLIALERQAYRTADVALATNESHRRIAIDRGSMRPERVFVVRSGPDLDRLRVHPPDQRWFRGKPHLIAYLGDISRQDGVDGLMRVVGHLSAIRDDFHCVVIGGGSALEEVRELAGHLGVQDIVTFTGVVSDETLCRILSSATIAVDTVPKNEWSDKSTMNKIVEYMYFGLPIVAYDIGETKNSAQKAVIVASSSSEQEFADLIGALLDDPSRREQMSEFGKNRLREKLAWGHSVPPLLEAYSVALKGRATR